MTVDRNASDLRDSLLKIFDRIEAAKNQHDKMEHSNKFLQQYVGDLVSRPKISPVDHNE